MALYNEILVGRINRFLQKYYGIKGSPPAPQLASDITTSLNMWNGCENRYLEGWNRFAGNFGVTAQAANPNGIKIRNPSGSNVIAVVEQVTGQAATADNLGVQHGVSSTNYNTLPSLAATRLDPRGNPQPTLIVSNTSGAQSPVAFGATIDSIGIPAALLGQRIALIFEDFQAIPLLPGDALQVAGSTNNNLLAVGFLWRERAMEEGELV